MCADIASSIATVAPTALVTTVILLVNSNILYAALHLFAVGCFISSCDDRKCQPTTQRGYRQCKGYKNQYKFAHPAIHRL